MKILIIQTAFIGDVILATSLVDLVRMNFPNAKIDFLLRKGNESLLKNHPNINRTLIWDKKNGKYINLIKLAFAARSEKYDHVLNIQRFASSGIFSLLCGAKNKIGFKQNPLSFTFSSKVEHKIPYKVNNNGTFLHEVQRNALLLAPIVENFILPNAKDIPPSLHFSNEDLVKVQLLTNNKNNYIVLAPSSVWFTKQWNKENWIKLKEELLSNFTLFFIGGPDDSEFIQSIILDSENCVNLCGKLSLTQSAALMKSATRVIVNDSAPLHLASAVNAKTTAVFCSTTPDFGYTPLAQDASVIETKQKLDCKPCGLHGKKACPLKHFDCATQIQTSQIIGTIQ